MDSPEESRKASHGFRESLASHNLKVNHPNHGPHLPDKVTLLGHHKRANPVGGGVGKPVPKHERAHYSSVMQLCRWIRDAPLLLTPPHL